MWAGGRNRSKAPAEQADPAFDGHRAGLSCPPKRTVREETVRLFHYPHTSSRAAIRATLDPPPRLASATLAGPTVLAV